MSSKVMSLTTFAPIIGNAYVSSVDRHWALCLSFLNSSILKPMYWLAASAKVISWFGFVVVLRGSVPSRANCLFVRAVSLADESETVGKLPRPISCRLPLNVIR